MTRDNAIAILRHGLKHLPPGEVRTQAFNAFDQLVVAVNAEPEEEVVREAYYTLTMALPELKAAANRLLDDWSWKADGAAPMTYAARREAREK